MGMDELGSAQVINEEAARWVARIDSGPLAGEVKVELDQWLARDDRHRGAMFRALAIWQALNGDKVLDHGIWDSIERGPNPDDDDVEKIEDAGEPLADRQFARRRLLSIGGAIAASLVSVAFIPRIWAPNTDDNYRKNIKTNLGEMAKVPLRDGSLVVVNTASRLEVAQSASVRNVRLENGEAWFHVAKDASRPFIVAAGDVRVRAVGTAFAVRRREGGAEVQVTEGIVEVWTEGQETKRAQVPAGVRTFVSEQSGAQLLVEDAADIERKLSWREGALSFRGNTIREAVAEFNRYNATKLEVDSALADEKIIGRFRAKEPDSFAREVSLAFGARIEREGSRIRIEQN
jgi:transmembrane sensor